MELIAGVRGCVLEGPHAGAATVRAAKATAANFTGAIVMSWRLEVRDENRKTSKVGDNMSLSTT